ncbi:U1 small nuclear ribonucleoprotein [Helicobacter baculiformis]|uniref:U1 small nuclear ribonucleoprotein n=1 Tax=Helicobacter baculiformis TaxID=427351 RepID=A0ABV7ZKR9_9HELI|nr:U1 small nuclear ribonucleoprotein [Helicobacter baculiformis]
MKQAGLLPLGVIALLGGCWVGDPSDVNPNLPDVDTLNECAEIKNECVGNKDGDIPTESKPKKYGEFHTISLAGVKMAHGGKFAISPLPPSGGYMPYYPMSPMMYPGMYPYGMMHPMMGMYPMGMYPYGMYPMMMGMPMMYGPWW